MTFSSINLTNPLPFGNCYPFGSLFTGGSFSTPCMFNMPSIFTGINIFNNPLDMSCGFIGTDFLPYTPPANFGYIPPMPAMRISVEEPDNIFGFLRTGKVSGKKINTSTNLLNFNKTGYNAAKGRKLAAEISKINTGFDGFCARHVKHAIEDAGLGDYVKGDGWQMASVLANNKNFKEISTKGLSLSSLPAGCILVYDRGTAGYSSKFGHTEITLGDGTAASGGITKNIRDGARVFIPV